MRKGPNNLRKALVLLVMVVTVMGLYYNLANRNKTESEEDKTTAVQAVLLHNLENNYPATPREVLKFYNDIMQCYYNETYTEDELEKLGEKAFTMYDAELAANQDYASYQQNLKRDVQHYKEAGIVISSQAIASSTDVDYFTREGRECARLRCVYTMREGTTLSTVKEIYVMRRDEDNHWKILGWSTYTDEPSNE